MRFSEETAHVSRALDELPAFKEFASSTTAVFFTQVRKGRNGTLHSTENCSSKTGRSAEVEVSLLDTLVGSEYCCHWCQNSRKDDEGRILFREGLARVLAEVGELLTELVPDGLVKQQQEFACGYKVSEDFHPSPAEIVFFPARVTSYVNFARSLTDELHDVLPPYPGRETDLEGFTSAMTTAIRPFEDWMVGPGREQLTRIFRAAHEGEHVSDGFWFPAIDDLQEHLTALVAKDARYLLVECANHMVAAIGAGLDPREVAWAHASSKSFDLDTLDQLPLHAAVSEDVLLRDGLEDAWQSLVQEQVAESIEALVKLLTPVDVDDPWVLACQSPTPRFAEALDPAIFYAFEVPGQPEAVYGPLSVLRNLSDFEVALTPLPDSAIPAQVFVLAKTLRTDLELETFEEAVSQAVLAW